MKKILIAFLFLCSYLLAFSQQREEIMYKDNKIIIIETQHVEGDIYNYKYIGVRTDAEAFNRLKEKAEQPIKDNYNKELQKFKTHIIDSLENAYNSKIQDIDYSKIFDKYYAKSSLNFNLKLAIPRVTDVGWETKTGNITSFEALYEYQFSRSGMFNGQQIATVIPFSIEAGLGFSYTTKEAYLENQSFNLNDQIDVFGYNYNADYTIHKITEKFNYFSIDIPVYFKFGKTNLKKVSPWLKFGVINSINLSSKTDLNAIATRKGFYPAWNIVIFDVPELDYYTNQETNQQFSGIKENNLKSYTLWGAFAVGLKIPLNNYKTTKAANFLLNIGLNCKYSFMPISYSSIIPDSYSPNPDGKYIDLNTTNFMHNGNKIFALGAEIGIIYVFNNINTK